MKDRLITNYEELVGYPVGKHIPEPNKLLFVGLIPSFICSKIGVVKNTSVFISRMALKHIIERRESMAYSFIKAIPIAISQPVKVVDNSLKRENSFLFIHHDVAIICVVVEKTKTTRICQVVSAFPVHFKIYKKMIDISGRAELPPFELPS